MLNSRFLGVLLAAVLVLEFGSATAQAEHRSCGYGYSIGGYRHYANYSNQVRYVRPNYYYSVPNYGPYNYHYYPGDTLGLGAGRVDVYRGGIHFDLHGGHFGGYSGGHFGGYSGGHFGGHGGHHGGHGGHHGGHGGHHGGHGGHHGGHGGHH